MKLGKQPSPHALTKQEPHQNTSWYECMSACKEKHLKSLKIWDTATAYETDANQEVELGSGSLYITLQGKFNKNLLAKNKQWVGENQRTEDVKTLREFIDRESEFLTTVSETMPGVLSVSKKERSLFAKEDPEPKKRPVKKSKVCKESHILWTSEN